MSFEDFAASVGREAKPPEGMGAALRALWEDGRDDWASAHRAAQADASDEAAWVHAYLHRKEGDLSNAGYWYERAGRSLPAREVTPRAEWEQIARTLLGDERKT